MRAEHEALSRDIAKSTALLRRRLDWDVALRRLDELNALSESPDLWNDPKEAQALMRERNKIQASVDAVRKLERDLADNVELAEMAEAEGDEDMIEEARLGLLEAKTTGARAELGLGDDLASDVCALGGCAGHEC
jgi:peptide chain release factor 2